MTSSLCLFAELITTRVVANLGHHRLPYLELSTETLTKSSVVDRITTIGGHLRNRQKKTNIETYAHQCDEIITSSFQLLASKIISCPKKSSHRLLFIAERIGKVYDMVHKSVVHI